MIKEEYKEGKFSLVTHQGEMYQVDDLILATKSKPVTKIPVKDLAWIMKYTSTDKGRVANASLKFPVIVLDDGNKKYVLDGAHRLKQAMNLMEKTIKAVVLTPQEMPLPVLHGCDNDYQLISYTQGPLTHETRVLLNDFAKSVGDGVTADDLFKSPFIYLLCKNRRKLGFVSFKILEDNTVHISALGIATQHRKHGYGFILMYEFIKLIMSRSRFHQVKLGVRSDNVEAKNLYIRLGFTHVESGFDGDVAFDTFIYTK